MTIMPGSGEQTELEAVAAAPTLHEDDLGEARPLRVDVWRRFRRNKLAMLGLFVIAFLVLVAVFAPLIAPFDYDQRTPGASRLPPDLFGTHRFGTDVAGFDLFSRVVYGRASRSRSASRPPRWPSSSASRSAPWPASSAG